MSPQLPYFNLSAEWDWEWTATNHHARVALCKVHQHVFREAQWGDGANSGGRGRGRGVCEGRSSVRVPLLGGRIPEGTDIILKRTCLLAEDEVNFVIFSLEDAPAASST